MGNPFIDSSGDLITLDTKVVLDKSVANTIRTIEDIGQKQYNVFVSERLVKRTQTVFDIVHKNKLPLLNAVPKKIMSKSQLQMKSLKMDRSLFARLFVSVQTRCGDIDEFFQHENHIYPPSLSEFGQLRLPTNKSDILSCLPDINSIDAIPNATAMVLDGAVIVNLLMPSESQTFNDYSKNVFTSYILQQFKRVSRLDLIWDQYLPNSLKDTTRQKRGTGIERRVTPTGKIPSNWQDFLKVGRNKTELFNFLTAQLQQIMIPEGKELYVTLGTTVIKCGSSNVSSMTDCNHEEADTRIFVHVAHAAETGHYFCPLHPYFS